MKINLFMPLAKPLLGIVLSFFSFYAVAQDYNESFYDSKRMSLGITFSPNVSWLRYGDVDVEGTKAKMGYAYGLLADFAFSENYYFSTGFLINTLNAEARRYTTVPENQQRFVEVNDYRLQYAEIPFGVKLKSTQRYYRSYYGLFGFTAGIKINAKQEVTAENGTLLQESRNLKGRADLFRLGLQVGGGVEWQLDHNLRLMTGLSFNNGFTRVIKSDSPRNSFVSFNFGILF
ncbi:outer membrane beta-barrel protein [Olivibacter sp. SDN3]|uniref:outer membrane beta-barrel protein n=1 Tax=Olivibacter sp. SDN3 TaxID=2764720 RepID=UPI00165117FE|nr:outer membrane beta-barrel protein [Olivibacter sp. SDN3]QNL50022.1 outer membrane beta-barrel protein [Olivibacter sp. SDN3]